MSATLAVAPEVVETAERTASAGHVTASRLGPTLGTGIGGLDPARPLDPA